MNDGGIITIDVSNRRTSLVVWEGSHPRSVHQLGTERNRTSDELRVLFEGLLGGSALSIDRCAIACVVPGLEAVVHSAARDQFGIDPLLVQPGVRTGLDIRTEDPREVGPDRIANAVAAIETHGSPVIIIDMATALSLDVVGAHDQYLGAIIAPGPEVALEALAGRAARLGTISLSPDPVPPAIARSTETAIRSGILGGAIGMIDGLVEQIHQELGPAHVVATGEPPLAAAIAARSCVIDSFDPLLTHRGLASILRSTDSASNAGASDRVVP